MGIFNNLFGNKEIPEYNLSLGIGSFLLNAAHSAIPLFLREKLSNRRNASFEVLLFNSQHLLQILHRKVPLKYDEIERKFYKELFAYARINGFDKNIPIGLSDFVNNRFELYYNEMKNLHEIKGFIPSRTIYNFYDNPLKLKPEISYNAPKAFEFINALKYVEDLLEGSVDIALS